MTQNHHNILLERAYTGDAQAQHQLGLLYRNFDLMLPAEDEQRPFLPTLLAAKKWLTAAAQQGLTAAQLDLADMLSLEMPSTEHYAEAIQLYKQVAEQQEGAAWIRLGMMAEQGQGQKRNYALAAEYYQKAADLNLPLGYFNLALLYQHGKGVEMDPQHAIALFAKAEALGDHLSPYYRAQLLESTSPLEALEAYNKAIELGVNEAIFASALLLDRLKRYEEARPRLEEVTHWGGSLSQRAKQLLEMPYYQ